MIKLNIQRFSSTNKTTHYELSQYVSSDLPTYLVDYNSDMSKIDTGINTAQTTADTASTAASNAQTAAEGAQNTANTAVTNAATADGKAVQAQTDIGTLANLTTAAKTNLVAAINEVDDKIVTSYSTATNKSYDCSYVNSKVEDLFRATEFKTNSEFVDSNNKHWPIYRQCINFTTGNVTAWTLLEHISNFQKLIDIEFTCDAGHYTYPGGGGVSVIVCATTSGTEIKGDIMYKVDDSFWANQNLEIVIEYTKSTD